VFEQVGAEEIYKEYSTVFDYFSDERFSPSNKYFIEFVARLIRDKSKICDVGGGTGYFTQKITENKPDAQLVFIEPSQSMLKQAEARLGKNCVYLNKTLDQVVNTLDKQDVFIFQRSFYHLCKDVDSSKSLIKKLYDLTNEHGFVCIQDVPVLYNLPELEKFLHDKHVEHGLSVETFREKWPVLEKVLKDFNDRVVRNDYFRVPADAFIVFFIFAGFSLFHYSAEHGVFFFCKTSQPLISPT
jgi:hypothetical protein